MKKSKIIKKGLFIGACSAMISSGVLGIPALANTSGSGEAQIDQTLLEKQKQIDQYLFETHADEIAKHGFNITHTGPMGSYVEIGILPYTEENANYLYEIFGKESILVVEGIQATPFPLAPSDTPMASGIKVLLNGEYVPMDVKPFTESNRTLVPVRAVMEKLGAEVNWNQKNSAVEIVAGEISIKLAIGSNKATVIKNGTAQTLTLDVPAKVREGRTFVAVRFVAETLGAEVNWNGDAQTVLIDLKNEFINVSKFKGVARGFGEALKMVSLMAAEEIVKQEMEEHYGNLVAVQLIEKWQSEPENAPGRLTSSPWPDRIEILNVEKITDAKYKVEGEIIEVISGSNEAVAKRPITLTVEDIQLLWIITDVKMGAYEEVQ